MINSIITILLIGVFILGLYRMYNFLNLVFDFGRKYDTVFGDKSNWQKEDLEVFNGSKRSLIQFVGVIFPLLLVIVFLIKMVEYFWLK